MEINKILGKKYNNISKIVNHSYLGAVIVLLDKDVKIPEKIEERWNKQKYDLIIWWKNYMKW